MRILGRYIIRELIPPFFISISLIMLLFTLNLAFRMLNRIVGQGLSWNIIVEFFFLNLAWILTLAVPMSVLIACLMAYGRLAGDFEIVAMKASGLSLLKLIQPTLIAAMFVGAFSLYFQDQILPDFNHRNKLLTISIRKKKPNVAIREGIFTKDIPKQTLLVKRINPETDMLYSLTIFDDSDSRQPATVVADSGKLAFIDTLGMYQFKLFNGEIHQMKREEPEGYEVLEFEEALFRIDASDQLLHRREKGYRGDRELSLKQLNGRIEELKQRPDPERQKKQMNRYKVEYHKKFSISAAVIVFVMIGAPLGIKLHKGGLGVSGGFSVFFFLLYWVFLIGGEDLADRGVVTPWLAMWSPNMLLFLLGLILIRLEMRQHSIIQFPWQKKRLDEEEDKTGWKLTDAEVEEYARLEEERRIKESGSIEKESNSDSKTLKTDQSNPGDTDANS